MRWASSLSRKGESGAAFEEAAGSLEEELEGRAPDLLLVFASPDHADGLERVAALAARRFPRAVVAGCTAAGVIGGAHEAEDGPALSLTAAALPGAELSAFHVKPVARTHGEGGASAWRDRVGRPPEARPKFLLLADPFTADAGGILEGLDRAYPGAPKFGGLASGGNGPGENRLLVGRDVHAAGTAAVVFTGDVTVDTLVAQGCRPIGKPMLVTRCNGSVLQELDGKRPTKVAQEIFRSVGPRDQDLMRHSLYLGLEMRSDAIEYDPRDLLVRNLVGADEGSGALVVGAELRPMSVAQFVLRDAHSAEEELRRMLASARRAGRRPAGALLFSCVGRGAGLFGFADHDTALFEEQLGPAPLGGFFANGEIGPVGGTTFLHGYTSAFALFREPDGPEPPAAPSR